MRTSAPVETQRLQFPEGTDLQKGSKTEVREALRAKGPHPKRVFNSCIQIARKIPGAKLRFTKNDNPYFIISVAQKNGDIIDASIMPFLKVVRDKDNQVKKKNNRAVKHLRVYLRWPFDGNRSTPQEALSFLNVNHLIDYLSGRKEPLN